MTNTYVNEDGVLVIDATAVLESTTGLGQTFVPDHGEQIETEGEVSGDVIRDCAGE